MKAWAIAIGARAFIAAGFYYWLEGSVGAGRLTQFVLWFLALGSIWAAHTQIEKPSPWKRRPFLWKWFNRIFDLAVVCLLVWLACPVLAAMWMLAVIAVSVARTVPTAAS